MKKSLSLTGVLLILVCLSYCKKDTSLQEKDNVITPIKLSLTDIDYNQIGIKHNEELDIAFKALKEARSKGILKNEDCFKIVKGTILAMAEGTSEKPTEEQMITLKNKVNGYQKIFLDYTKSFKKGDPDLSTNFLKEGDSLMTDHQISISNCMYSILLNKNYSIEIMEQKFDSLENVIKLTCDENEKPSLLIGISIARHSSNYWHDNFSKWQNELGLSASKNEADPYTWKFVAVFDVIAAVYEGIVASPLICFPFIGWGAYATAVGITTGIVSGLAVIALIILNNIE